MSTTTKSKLRFEVGDEVIVTNVRDTYLPRSLAGKRGTIESLNPTPRRAYSVSVDEGATLFLNESNVRLRRPAQVGDRVIVKRVPKYAPKRVLGQTGKVVGTSWTSRWDLHVKLDGDEGGLHANADELRRIPEPEPSVKVGDRVRVSRTPKHAPPSVVGRTGTVERMTPRSGWAFLIRFDDGNGSVFADERDVELLDRTPGETSTGAQSTRSASVGTSPLRDNEAKVNRVAVALLKSSAPDEAKTLLTVARTAVHAAGPGGSVTDRVNAVALSVLKAGDKDAAEDVLKLARAAVAAA